MTTILAVETATPSGGIALFRDGAMLAVHRFERVRPASETLIPAIKMMLDQNEIMVSDLDKMAVSIGPGSFTGLRVGLTAVKTLGVFQGVPVVPVPTLMGMAHAVGQTDKVVGAILDARKKEVFGAYFRVSDKIERLTDDEVLPVKEFLVKCPGDETLLVGNGIAEYGEEIAGSGVKCEFAAESLWEPSPEAIGKLVHNENLPELSGDEVMKLSPVYIRRSEAELNWKKRHGSS